MSDNKIKNIIIDGANSIKNIADSIIGKKEVKDSSINNAPEVKKAGWFEAEVKKEGGKKEDIGALSEQEGYNLKVQFLLELDKIGYNKAIELNYKLASQLEDAIEEASKNRTPKNVRKQEIISIKRFACFEWLRNYEFINNIIIDDDDDDKIINIIRL
jgi:hypothetical protein